MNLSNGRGGNTLEEQKNSVKRTAERRMQKKIRDEKNYQGRGKDGTGGTKLKSCDMEERYLAGFGLSIDAVLHDVMSKSAPHMWEKQLLGVIKLYDDADIRCRIHAIMDAISRLRKRLEEDEDIPMMRLILRKMLRSYERRLVEARDTQTSTPPSSDDEDADEHIEMFKDFAPSKHPASSYADIEKTLISQSHEGQEMYDPPTITEGIKLKVDETIQPVETTKTYKKIYKSQPSHHRGRQGIIYYY